MQPEYIMSLSSRCDAVVFAIAASPSDTIAVVLALLLLPLMASTTSDTDARRGKLLL